MGLIILSFGAIYELRQLEEEAARRGMSKSKLIRSLIARFPAPTS
ncbi:MAG: ribbon-helix-helix protein, CopG family [Coleofasciculus sp. C3-bin4]|nr:ribbon-helix-helix protein, CopG family [Coleofasciculus sp. C3-bin4]